MKKYDFEKAVKLIDGNKESLKSASLGMHEDWFWTAETIFENGEFKQIFNDDTTIGGIQSSSWATPTINLEFKDGSEKMIPCYKGESDRETSPLGSLGLGVLSKSTQDNITPLEEE